jgi:hypothetical protein
MSDFRFPEFDDLPTVQGQPKGCLWGFFDVDGKKDQLGSEFCSPYNTAFVFLLHSVSLLNIETLY